MLGIYTFKTLHSKGDSHLILFGAESINSLFVCNIFCCKKLSLFMFQRFCCMTLVWYKEADCIYCI